MTRHILALIALVTGMAALTSPANASLAHAISGNVGVSAEASTSPAKEFCEAVALPAKRVAHCSAPRLAGWNHRAVKASAPSVLVKIDRAYE